MRDHFQYKCSRRSLPKRSSTQGCLDRIEFGAGSGGGPEQGGPAHYHDGTYAMVANQVQILSMPSLPPQPQVPYVVTVLAAGMGTDGRVEIGASQGVRLTAGPPNLPPLSSEGTNGAEIVVGETQEIRLERGLIPGIDQQITMTPGAITIDGGTGSITIQSMTEIKLQIGYGISSITLTPDGITIEGLLVQIN